MHGTHQVFYADSCFLLLRAQFCFTMQISTLFAQRTLLWCTFGQFTEAQRVLKKKGNTSPSNLNLSCFFFAQDYGQTSQNLKFLMRMHHLKLQLQVCKFTPIRQTLLQRDNFGNEEWKLLQRNKSRGLNASEAQIRKNLTRCDKMT